MVELIDFLSTSNTVSTVGHTLFLFTNIVNFVYLDFFEWYIHDRWSRNIFSQIMTFGVVAQMISCVASISRYNMDDEYQKTLSWIGATAFHIGLATMNICSVFLFFNIHYKKYIILASAAAIASAIAVTIIEFVFWDSLLFLPGKIFLLTSAVWQTASIISAFVAHRKHKLHHTVALDVIKQQDRHFIFAILLHCFAIGCILSGLPILHYPGTGLLYFNFVSLGLTVGIMDFMPHDQPGHITYAATSGDEETAEIDENKTTDFGLSAEAIIPSDESERGCCFIALCPIRQHQIVQSERGGIERQIVIAPEAFRMWFYFGVIIYSVIAISVSLTSSELDIKDNPILNRFGNNNLCIFFDFPPFSYFGTTLWLPQVFTLLAWEWFDHSRVYGDYLAKSISSKVYYGYTVLTIYESLAICFFAQITATSPLESMYLHSIPWIILCFALWTIAFKRFLYFEKEHMFDKHGVWWMNVLGWIYIVLLAITVIIKIGFNIPNLFEAYLWKRKGLEWTSTLTEWNDRVFLFLDLVCPMVFYFIFSKDMHTVKLAQFIPQ